MNEVEIGLTKRAMRGYSFDDVAVVPSRRTRDPEDVSVSWSIDAFSFDMPVIAAPMDSVMSPESAIAIGKLGGLGVLKSGMQVFPLQEPSPPSAPRNSPAPCCRPVSTCSSFEEQRSVRST